MTIPQHIFKGYDIRGIYPTELNEENIVPIIKAIFWFLTKDEPEDKKITLVVGTDMRISSPSLTKVAIDTLVNLGANVIDVGKVSTPTFYFSVSNYGYESGIQITASHNPKEWNGIKMVKRGPKGLIKIGKTTGLEEIKKAAIEGFDIKPRGVGSVIKKRGVVDDEAENALKLFDYPKVNNFKIVADPANAMGSTYIDAFFKLVPADLIRMNFELDGTFPAHQPDPLQFDTLKDLRKKVVEEKADFGLAPDGDGDRLFLIDEKGQVLPGTILTAIIAKELLKKFPGEQILFDIRNIFTPKKIIEENGGKPGIIRVGHAYITEALNETGAIFAGEGSGHFFYRAAGNAESQVITILTVLLALTEENKTLSQLVEEVKRSFESGETNFKVSNAPEILEALKEKYRDGNLDSLDGISITYPNWRFNVRTSNTEPLLRLNLESYSKDEMEQKRDELVGMIKTIAKP